MEIVFFGTSRFAVLPLQTLLKEAYKVLAVVTQPDRQSGRGRHLKASAVKTEAEKAGVPILQPHRENLTLTSEEFPRKTRFETQK